VNKIQRERSYIELKLSSVNKESTCCVLFSHYTYIHCIPQEKAKKKFKTVGERAKTELIIVVINISQTNQFLYKMHDASSSFLRCMIQRERKQKKI